LAVFDGHGGREVAETAALRIVEHISAQESYPGNLPEALKKGFLAFDEVS
jgi:serine/threonine protein phosphatase PrpC